MKKLGELAIAITAKVIKTPKRTGRWSRFLYPGRRTGGSADPGQPVVHWRAKSPIMNSNANFVI